MWSQIKLNCYRPVKVTAKTVFDKETMVNVELYVELGRIQFTSIYITKIDNGNRTHDLPYTENGGREVISSQETNH